MGNVHTADFMVVGAGMAGASVAASLAEVGRVSVLEAERHAGYHSTGRSAAIYAENYGNAAIRALTRASRQFLFEPPAGFASVPLCSAREAVYFARADQLDELRAFRADPDVLLATRELTVADIDARIPLFREGYLAGGLLDRGAADLDVDAIHQGFLRQARVRGAELHFESPVRALRREGGLWVASTPQGEFGAPVVVNAAGAWADELAALAGAAPAGLQPMRRTAVLIPVPGGLHAEAWPVAIDISEQFYFKPDAGLLMVSPADESPCPPCDVQPEELDVAIAIDRFEQATGVEVRQVRRSWAGLRVFAPDRTPVVGFDPVAEGFFWLAGQGGYGIQTAPALGRLAAALASGRAAPADILCHGVDPVVLAKARFASSEAPSLQPTKATSP
jgi:D-arginine dehydrogenase